MKSIIARLISCLIPNKKLRKKIRKLGNESTHRVKSEYYGKIYTPYYSDYKIDSCIPEIYNKNGEKMDTFFLRDCMMTSSPYVEMSKYFLWDRYNIGLDTHFYTHQTMLETVGKPNKRYGYFIESESVFPDDYEIFETHKGIEKDFDAIFTYSEKLLSSLDNAKYFPSCSSIWYAKELGNNRSKLMHENLYQFKTKNLSMICSNKMISKMHKIRYDIAKKALKTNLCDLYGRIEGGTFLEYKSSALEKYRFHIVVENDIKPYYFTEKIMDCFASMTIPIYYGADKISEYFNPDGIIKFDENSDIEKIIKNCTEEEYLSRLEAIKDNYKRSLKYLNLDDLLYEMYFKN